MQSERVCDFDGIYREQKKLAVIYKYGCITCIVSERSIIMEYNMDPSFDIQLKMWNTSCVNS